MINFDVGLLHWDSREIPKSEGVNSTRKLIFRKISKREIAQSMLNKTFKSSLPVALRASIFSESVEQVRFLFWKRRKLVVEEQLLTKSAILTKPFSVRVAVEKSKEKLRCEFAKMLGTDLNVN